MFKRLVRETLEKQKKGEVRDYTQGLLEQKMARKFGCHKGFEELRNPLRRISLEHGSEQSVVPYFNCWSRVHTVYCHYAAQANDFNAMVYHVIFDESGQYILSASVDGLVKIFDRGMNLQTSLRGHSKEINILTLSADNRFVISSDESGLVRLWEFPSGRSVAVLTEQVGHDLTTLTFHTETQYDSQMDCEVPWRAFLLSSSSTGGLIVYDERSIGRRGLSSAQRGQATA